jgi:cell division septation protein DedD
MKNFLFLTLGIIIIASLIFLLGYLVGRGYKLGDELTAGPVSVGEPEKEKIISPSRSIQESPPEEIILHRPGNKDLAEFTVQVLSSQSREKALALVDRLKGRGYPAYIEEADIRDKKWFRVRVGFFMSRGEAQVLVDKLKSGEDLKDAMVWKRER